MKQYHASYRYHSSEYISNESIITSHHHHHHHHQANQDIRIQHEMLQTGSELVAAFSSWQNQQHLAQQFRSSRTRTEDERQADAPPSDPDMLQVSTSRWCCCVGLMNCFSLHLFSFTVSSVQHWENYPSLYK